MVFNSSVFLVFFLVVYALYWLTRGRLAWQNRLLLVSSFVFYGWWDWRFLLLMSTTIASDHLIARRLSLTEDPVRRKRWVVLSACVNLSLLGFFKYYNFFADSLRAAFGRLGVEVGGPALEIILPVGISFYTFQSMSYVIDVYRRQLDPAPSLVDYAAYVSYFPQLVAGPIERGSRLLPQMLRPRTIRLDQVYEGGYLIFWGLFKKMFVADNLARIADPLFAHAGPHNGAAVWIGLYAFAFQIYCDFSGYSDIARGLGKCMGFDIMVNFNLPYFSSNPSEFWRRWHVSLSTWLRDYLYVPMGGSRRGAFRTYRNLLVTMLLGGLWHGAQWTFVVWGAYHGALLVVHRLWSGLRAEREPARAGGFLRSAWRGLRVILFFHLVCVGWLFFRAESIGQALEMLAAAFTRVEVTPGIGLGSAAAALLGYSFPLLAVQGLQWQRRDSLAVLKIPAVPRAGVYLALFYLLWLFGAPAGKEFIYFQF